MLTMTRIQDLTLTKFTFHSLMASSEVDQKFLGRFAKYTGNANPLLSAILYKVLGLSVLLSKKLIRARRLRRLDTTRDTKSLSLYHHIIFLAREGLIMLLEYVLPTVENYAFELRVLSHKLRASFFHVFVLFHNQPSIHQTVIPSFLLDPAAEKGKAPTRRDSLRISPTPSQSGPLPNAGTLPPGLAPVSVAKPSATFLLPSRNYIPEATAYFRYAGDLADRYLAGSHPIRLSVKTEYSAYLYDCLHDGDGSRRLARMAIRDVYHAPEGMDDDMFEDAAEMVGILGKMMKRGLSGTSGSADSRSTGTTPRTTPQSTPRAAGFEGEVPPPVPSKDGKKQGRDSTVISLESLHQDEVSR